ncbi:sugar ABC transporter permease [Gilliamella sp. Fer2-1]|jgi:capsular polysaccharide transport system permease protein|uniref:ABC transporter permease n=1 Tax=unclassified Gilliamella TaxID=2685620 RepID=UPI00080D9C6C|nr:ABC transporter permease [Gilliamella apicola]OCG42223.1 sugar ABC transporter permease [Gilliamella apicola]OCG60723.1 sugar ABC transporter permease [Gilliamella apicola]OCG70306.1 sugar ABC transporter permease [Gilliamella apicola]
MAEVVTQTSFIRSLKIQANVLNALILREIITRYGRNNIGFLWLFVEPMSLTFLISLMWFFFKINHVSNLNIVAFVLTGYPMAMMWRNASSRAKGSVTANQALLYHRNIKILDLVYARVFLEMIGASAAQVFVILLFTFVGLIAMPYDPFYMLCAWGLMSWFSLGLGLIIFVLSAKYEVFNKMWSTLSFILMPLSGAFFWIDTFPGNIQEILLYIPPVNGTEMFRSGYFGPSVITHYNVNYLVLCNIVLLFVGLTMVKINENHILEDN